MYQTTVKRVSLPEGRRVFAVSDIHGGLTPLRQAMDQAGFSKDDILFVVGDYAERGLENLAVFREIMGLCQTHTVYPLMGNTDLSRLEWLSEGGRQAAQEFWDTSVRLRDYYGSGLLWDMCRETGMTLTSAEELEAAIPALRQHFQPELSFLQNLATIIETEQYIFVHGGLPHERLDEFSGMSAWPYLKNDAFIDKGVCFDKWLVVGHWPVALYRSDRYCHAPFVSEKQHILGIDGGFGVKRDGQVNLVELSPKGGQPKAVYSADVLPKVVALDHQEPQAGTVFISWVTRQVEVSERKGSFALIRHLHSGRQLWVSEAFLYQDSGGDCCQDYSNELLAVEPGDILSLVFSADGERLVKKGSVIGRYLGRVDRYEDTKVRRFL